MRMCAHSPRDIQDPDPSFVTWNAIAAKNKPVWRVLLLYLVVSPAL